MKTIRKRIKKVFKKSKLILVGVLTIVSWWFFFKWGFNFKHYTSITNIPNSCFVDSLIWASKCNFYLKTHTDVWNSIYCFVYYYSDDPELIIGHAVTVFEHANSLWMYDPNWGTMPIALVGNREEYEEKIKLYITKTYNIILIEGFFADDWIYVQRLKEKRMNETKPKVSIYLDEEKKE